MSITDPAPHSVRSRMEASQPQPQPKKAQMGGFVFSSDGSFARADPPPPEFIDKPANPNFFEGVASRDVIVSEERKIWVRIFHPELPDSSAKLPVVIYFHGGGFVLLSPASSFFHVLCESLSKKLGAIVVSANYRLAPEHKLPAAYDDCYSVLEWVRDRIEELPWLRADLSRTFVMGDSAGGNISAQIALRVAQNSDCGIRVAGQILLQPFFSGVARSDSELRLASGPLITLDSCDFCWRACLPEGADRDHRFCNPAAAMADLRGEIDLARALVVVGGMDLLRDRQVELAKILEAAGKRVKLVEYEDAPHGFYVIPDQRHNTTALFDELARFLEA